MASHRRVSMQRSSSPDLLALPISDATSSPARPSKRVNLATTPTPHRKPRDMHGNSVKIQDFYIDTPTAPRSAAAARSPSRTIAQTDDLISPWRIRVRVEAEHQETPRGKGRGRPPASPSPRKLFGGNARTTTIPLKGIEAASSPRKRGRPRRSNGTPDPRAATPARRQRGSDVPDQAAELAETPGTSSPMKRKRGRPRRSEAPADGADAAANTTRPQALPLSEAASTAKKGKRGRRKSMGPVDIAADSDAAEDQDAIPFDIDDVHAQEIQLLNPRRSLLSTEALRERSSVSPQKGQRGNLLSARAKRYSQDPTEFHNDFDSIMESEGFSMITLGSVPSAQQFNSRPQDSPTSADDGDIPAEEVGLVEAESSPEHDYTNDAPPEDDQPRPQSPEAEEPPESRPTPSLLTRTAQFLGRFRQKTPQQTSSPARVPVLPTVEVSPSPHVANPPTREAQQVSSIQRTMQAGRALQSALDSEREVSTPVRSPASAATEGSPKERLDDLFSGFGSSTRREMRAGQRLGEELARRQQKAVAKTTTSPQMKDGDVFRSGGKQRSPVAEAYTLTVPQPLYPQLPAQQLPSPEDSLERNDVDEMSWRVDTPDRVATVHRPPAVPADPKPARTFLSKQSFAVTEERRTHPSSAEEPRSKPISSRSTPLVESAAAISRSSEMPTAPVLATSEQPKPKPKTMAQREAEWQAERDAVTKQINDANASRVVLVNSDDITPSGLRHDEDEEDIESEDDVESGGDVPDIDIYDDEEDAEHDGAIPKEDLHDNDKGLEEGGDVPDVDVYDSDRELEAGGEIPDVAGFDNGEDIDHGIEVPDINAHDSDEVMEDVDDIPNGGDETEDIWQLEAHSASLSHRESTAKRPEHAEADRLKPPRSKLPTPWRAQNDRQIIYSDDSPKPAASRKHDLSMEASPLPRKRARLEDAGREDDFEPEGMDTLRPRAPAHTSPTQRKRNGTENTATDNLQPKRVDTLHSRAPRRPLSASPKRPVGRMQKPLAEAAPVPVRVEETPIDEAAEDDSEMDESHAILSRAFTDASPSPQKHARNEKRGAAASQLQRRDIFRPRSSNHPLFASPKPATSRREGLLAGAAAAPRRNAGAGHTLDGDEAVADEDEAADDDFEPQGMDTVRSHASRYPTSVEKRVRSRLLGQASPQPVQNFARLAPSTNITAMPAAPKTSAASKLSPKTRPEQTQQRAKLAPAANITASSAAEIPRIYSKYRPTSQDQKQPPPRLASAANISSMRPSAPKTYSIAELSSDSAELEDDDVVELEEEQLLEEESEEGPEQTEEEDREDEGDEEDERDHTPISREASVFEVTYPDVSQNTTVVSLAPPLFQPALPSWLPTLPSRQTVSTTWAQLHATLSSATSLFSNPPPPSNYRSHPRPPSQPAPPTSTTSTSTRPPTAHHRNTFTRAPSTAPSSHPAASPPLTAHLPWTVTHFRRLDTLYADGLARPERYARLVVGYGGVATNASSGGGGGAASELVGRAVRSLGWEKRLAAWECGVVEAFLRALEDEGAWTDDDAPLIEAAEVARRVFGLWCGRVMRGRLPLRDEKVGLWDESLVANRPRALRRQEAWRLRNGRSRRGLFW